jgi:hypothetical protein
MRRGSGWLENPVFSIALARIAPSVANRPGMCSACALPDPAVRPNGEKKMIDEFIGQLAEKVGISEEQAKQVIEFLKENSDKIPELIGSDAVDSIKEKLGGLFG